MRSCFRLLSRGIGSVGSPLALKPFRPASSFCTQSNDVAVPQERVFSGIQPRGELHLGNYLGAVSNWVALQDRYAQKTERRKDGLLFCIVDLHSYTTDISPEELRLSTLRMAAALIACGIDPQRSILYPQSLVSGHSELMWLLACRTTLGHLNRMTQYKEKRASQGALLGLFAYPVLMAADILLYKATHVPVGNDQVQHLELVREIAASFNSRYQRDLFPLPKPLLTKAPRIMSLRDGKVKMSKSDTSDKSRINLADSKEQILSKIQKAKTDCIEKVSFDPESRPEVSNLLTIYASLTSTPLDQVCQQFSTATASDFKQALSQVLVDRIVPIGQQIESLMQRPQYLEQVLAEGAQTADRIARAHLAQIRETVGLLNLRPSHYKSNT